MTLTQFAKATAQRMVRAAASATLAVLGVNQVSSAFDLDWQNLGGVAGMAALVSLLMSLAGNYATNGNGPAFGDVEQTDGE